MTGIPVNGVQSDPGSLAKFIGLDELDAGRLQGALDLGEGRHVSAQIIRRSFDSLDRGDVHAGPLGQSAGGPAEQTTSGTNLGGCYQDRVLAPACLL